MIQKQTTTDPILDEIHRTGVARFRNVGGDLHGRSLTTLESRRKPLPAVPYGHPNRRTKRCNGAAEVTFLKMESPLPPPADRCRSSTRALLSTQEHQMYIATRLFVVAVACLYTSTADFAAQPANPRQSPSQININRTALADLYTEVAN